LDTLQEVLKQADFISLHVPGGHDTENLIGAKVQHHSTAQFVLVRSVADHSPAGVADVQEIAMMRKGSYLLNASRGKVVRVSLLASNLAAPSPCLLLPSCCCSCAGGFVRARGQIFLRVAP
jgi:phosphoglycerate dehydrogenase-like enzyme